MNNPLILDGVDWLAVLQICLVLCAILLAFVAVCVLVVAAGRCLWRRITIGRWRDPWRKYKG